MPIKRSKIEIILEESDEGITASTSNNINVYG
jgi:hypothetical protein